MEENSTDSIHSLIGVVVVVGIVVGIVVDANENHNDNDENNDENNNKTLTVGPSFCGKTTLLLNKLQLIRLCDSEEQIHIITRSPEQYSKAGFAYTITNTELC